MAELNMRVYRTWAFWRASPVSVLTPQRSTSFSMGATCTAKQ